MAYRAGLDDEDAFVGALLTAENYALHRSALTSGHEAGEPKTKRRRD